MLIIRPPPDRSRIIILVSDLNENDAFIYESMLIKLFGRKDINTGILRNRSEGGKGNSGWKATEQQKLNHYMKRSEWRKKQSERMSGEKNPFFGKCRSGKNNPMYGIERTPEWKESMRGKNNPVNRPEHQLFCENCNKSMPKQLYFRWGHGINCKKEHKGI